MELIHTEHNIKERKDGKVFRDVYTIGDHYVVTKYTTEYNDGNILYNILVQTSYEDKNYNFYPEIEYVDYWFEEDRKPEFKIQTAGYGSLTTEEIEKVINGFHEALSVVNVLEKAFC